MRALSRTIRTLAAVVALLLSAAPANAQQVCLLHGTAVAQLASQHSEQVLGRGLIGDGKAVVFLYSGDGPTTGARGRYMYLILDPADCVLDTKWVDGETFDRVHP